MQKSMNHITSHQVIPFPLANFSEMAVNTQRFDEIN